MRRAICPGTFDPVTLGHVDIFCRAAAMFDEVLVGVGRNSTKNPLFSASERMELARSCVTSLENVRVVEFTGLLVDFCRLHAVDTIVKGVRGGGDFDYEIQMAQMNRRLSGVETVLLSTAPEWAFVSSTMIREIAGLGGDVSAFVPPTVAARLSARVAGAPSKEMD